MTFERLSASSSVPRTPRVGKCRSARQTLRNEQTSSFLSECSHDPLRVDRSVVSPIFGESEEAARKASWDRMAIDGDEDRGQVESSCSACCFRKKVVREMSCLAIGSLRVGGRRKRWVMR